MTEEQIDTMNLFCDRGSCGKITQHDVFKRIENDNVAYVCICKECGHSDKKTNLKGEIINGK